MVTIDYLNKVGKSFQAELLNAGKSQPKIVALYEANLATIGVLTEQIDGIWTPPDNNKKRDDRYFGIDDEDF